MDISNLVLYGDERLKTKAIDIDVELIDDDFRNLVKAMYQFLYGLDGLGLAANQIGDERNFFILHESVLPKDVGITFINPRIVAVSGNEVVDYEGCLSLLFCGCEVTRDDAITLEYENIDGETKVIEANGLLGRVIQHEIDHLNGKMIVDDLSRLKRSRVVDKFKKLRKKVL